MNRLQKKCVITSLALHGLLLLILLFGSALMPSPKEDNTFRPLTMYSSAQVSEILASQGGPAQAQVAAPAPAPVAIPAPPQPTPQVQPQPPKPQVATPKVEPKVEPKPTPEPRHEPIRHETAKSDFEPVKPQKIKPAKDDFTPTVKHKIVLDDTSTKQAKRKAEDKQQQEQEAADAQARAVRKQAAQQFASAFKSISKNLSSSAPLVEFSEAGLGEGGQMTANYRDIIASKYYSAWIAPMGLADDTPVVAVSITIARDGSVVSSRIVKSSGNRVMDRSVQSALEAVTFIEPFPPGSRDQQKTVTIQFNVQAKRQIG